MQVGHDTMELSGIKKVVFHLSLVFDGLLVFLLSVPAMIIALFFAIFPRQQKDIYNDIVLVTGSGQGLGREMALLFAQQGCEMVCVDLNPEQNLETMKLIHAQGGKARAYVCNVADREAVMKLGKAVGRVDILVNNAGVYPVKSLWNASEDEIRAIIDINLFSQFWMAQAFLPGMKRRDYGHVVCISSISAMIALGYILPYAVSKFGLTGLMASLTQEIHAEKLSIKFTTVCPYVMNTRREIQECVTSRIPPIGAKEAAEDILQGIREELTTFTVPRSFIHLTNLCRMLPRKFEDTFLDYFPIEMKAPDYDEFKEMVESHRLRPTGAIEVQEVW